MSSIKVLLVEDNDLDQEAFIRKVRNDELPYEYRVVGSVEEARQVLMEEQFDVVLTDHSLGDGTGLDILEASTLAPVIMITGEGDETTAVKAIKAGAFDYLTKDDSSNYLRLLPITIENAIRHYQSGQKLAEAENTIKVLSLVADKTDNAIILADDQGFFEWVNDGFVKMTGYTLDEVKGTRGEVFNNIYSDLHQTADEIMDRVIAEKTSILYEAKRKSKDGREYWTHTNLIPILDSKGDILKIASLNSDISKRREAEAALKKAKEQAEASEKTKELFLANMSHEIRTPMNAIIGFTNLLQQTELNDEQLDYLQSIRGAGKNLLVIINDILDFSKIEANLMELEHIDFNLAETIDNVRKMLMPKANDKQLNFLVTRDENIPTWLVGDPVRLNQILVNLINNAIKFTKEGRVELKVQLVEKGDKQVTLQFDVSDTGIGIPPEKIDSIFESFVQSSSDTTRKFGGTGLGLTIVKRLIEMQGGHIHVTSEADKGATFTAKIPFTISEDQNRQSSPDQRNPDLARAAELGRLHILLAEDNEVNQKLAKRVLNNFGFEVTVAPDGKQAIEHLREQDFDLILMDVQMPELDGYEATRYIRKAFEGKKQATPIVAMTAHAMSGEKEKCLDAGMNDYVPKPFDTAELLQVIAQMVTQSANGTDDATADGDANKDLLSSMLNLTQLDYLSAGDKQFRKEILQTSYEQIPQEMNQINTYAQDQNWVKTKAHAHKLRSTCALLGNKYFCDLLYQIEHSEEEKVPLEALATPLSKLDEGVPHFLQALQTAIDT